MEMKYESEICDAIIQGTDTCFKQVHTTAFKRAGYFDETMQLVLGTQYDVNEVRD